MQPAQYMMASARNLVSSLGGETRVFARRFGQGTADVAKHVGGSTADLARKVGPTRGLIGLAIIGAAVGSFFLIRYLRERSEGVLDEEVDYDAREEPGTVAGRRARRLSRAKRRAMHAAQFGY